LDQALNNVQTGRPQDEEIRRKLGHGLSSKRRSVASTPTVHEDLMRIVYTLVHLGWNDKEEDKTRRKGAKSPRPFGNNIGGLIVDATNKIIAWGLNFKHVNPTFHAETMMIQYYLRRHNLTALPPKCRVYTSLECCHMCAGYIATVGRDVQVFYGQKDPNILGPNALARGKNGCSQHPSQLLYRALLALGMQPGSRDIIGFLFDRVGSRRVFGRAWAETRRSEYGGYRSGGQLNPILHEGSLFLMELQDMAVLHDCLGAPLTVVLDL
jgi:tRNA(Arg) A34 adenosine deaminase TadA